MREEWRPVVGFPDYMVSDLGRVYSHISQKFLALVEASNGYLVVKLPKGAVTVHSLVAAAFIGPRPAKADIRHLDGKKKNCCLGNLAYGTRSQNIRDDYRTGARSSATNQRRTQKASRTKTARYGENWPALTANGIAYSKAFRS